MSGAAWIAMLIAVVIFVIGMAVVSNSGKGKAKQARYCTKHVLTQSPIPGGPERLTWVYGNHRTRGNACDGAEHRRRSAWW
jgi:hypothetical protein